MTRINIYNLLRSLTRVARLLMYAGIIWLAIEGALFIRSTRSVIETNTPKIAASLDNLEKTTASSKEATERINLFLTVDRLRNWDNAVNTQIYSTQLFTNTYRDIAKEAIEMMRNNIEPAIDGLSQDTARTLTVARTAIAQASVDLSDNSKKVAALTEELRRQTKQNGDSINGLLEEGKSLIVGSKEDLLALIKEARETTQGLKIITNDPDILLTIKNVSDISTELDLLSHKLIDPIINPLKTTGVNKYFIQPVLKIAKFTNAVGAIFYMVSRFQ